MKRPLLDPTNDYVFKILFKDPEAERRLISMLTAILEPALPIVSAKVLNPEIPADLEAGKTIVLDLRVELADRSSVGVEMEASPRAAFVARDLFYWARNHAQQLAKGEGYENLRPTIGIAWTGGLLSGESRAATSPTRMHSRFRVRNVETNVDLTNQLELHVLELPKLHLDGTLSPSLRRWARFFDHPSEADLTTLAEEDDVMAETVNKLRVVSADEIHRQNAESRLRDVFAYRSELAAERDEGRKEGRVDGQRAFARRMVRRGIERAIVAEELGITEAELDAFLAET